ncbi:zinc finger protein 436-like isoform X2 [Palaemon carinicauda]|uniref:zinc finger protein 436-like isoform X2 n=1 Tax=Palaemon carinicauda TaxID=392227 RepID=UPI0035B67992
MKVISLGIKMEVKASLSQLQDTAIQLTSNSKVSSNKSFLPSENETLDGKTFTVDTSAKQHNLEEDIRQEDSDNSRCTVINHDLERCVGDDVEAGNSKNCDRKKLETHENSIESFHIKVEPPLECTNEPSEGITNNAVIVDGDNYNMLCKVKEENASMKCGTSEDCNSDTDTAKEAEVNVDEQVNLDVRNHLLCKLEVEDEVLNYDSSEDSSDTETEKEGKKGSVGETRVSENVKKNIFRMLEEEQAALDFSISQACGSDTERMKELQHKRKMAASGLGFPLYVCPYEGCEKEFNRPWRLAEHEHTHTGKRPFVCPVEGCGRTYVRKQHLQRHTATAHEENKPQEYFKCDVCNKMMKNRYSFAKHWYRAHIRQNYKCEECGQTFPKQQQLKSHSFVHTGVEPYLCDSPGCGARFMLPSRLRRHALVHVQNRYACPNETCGETFNVYHDLRKHLATSHPKVCNICGKEFKQLRQLKIHRETHGDVHNRLFSSVRDLDRSGYYGL